MEKGAVHLDPRPLERAPPGFRSKAGRWGLRSWPCGSLSGCHSPVNRVPGWGGGHTASVLCPTVKCTHVRVIISLAKEGPRKTFRPVQR